MDEHQMRLLLAVIERTITSELRSRLMVECPDAYNAWCGWNVVRVAMVPDAERDHRKAYEGQRQALEPYRCGVCFSTNNPCDCK